MKKDSVKLHEVYAAKVSGAVVPVRLDKENPHGGWDGTNMRTRKQVRIKSAQRLRGLWPKKTMPVTSDVATKVDDQSEPKPGEVAREVMQKRREATTGAEKPPTLAHAATGETKAAQDATPKAGRPKAKGGDAGAKKERNSLLNLAARVLAEAKVPMTCQEMVDKVLATGLWQTKGRTPAATLYSAVLRETQTKGDAARFRKVERGKFAIAK